MRLFAIASLVGSLSACAPDASVEGGEHLLASGEAGLEVGELESPASHVFGQIRDVEALSDGGFLVLDGRWMNVRRYSSTGGWLSEIGRRGDGPGEFQAPRSLAMLDDSTLLVLGGGRRINEFRLRAAEFLYIRDIHLDFFGRDLCVMNGRAFVQGAHRDQGIHEIDSEGRAVESFHAAPQHGFDLGAGWKAVLDDQALTGFIACLPDVGLVVVASSWLPTLFAYDALGNLVWRTTIPEFRPVVPTLAESGRAMQWERGEGADGVVALEVSPAGKLVVQTVHLVDRERARSVQPKTFLVDGASGDLTLVEEDVPLLHALSDSFAFGVAVDPFPRVIVIRLATD